MVASISGVPTQAWLDVDIRSLETARLHSIRNELRRIVTDAARNESAREPALALRPTLTPLGDRPAGMIDDCHPLVRAAAVATQAVGRTPQSASASTDANVPLSRGIPAIAIGAGGAGSAAHTADEWYDDAQSEIGLERVIRLVIALGTTDHL